MNRTKKAPPGESGSAGVARETDVIGQGGVRGNGKGEAMAHACQEGSEFELCLRCEKREAGASLVVSWRRGLGGEDTDALQAWVCERCAHVFLDAWDAVVERECGRDGDGK